MSSGLPIGALGASEGNIVQPRGRYKRFGHPTALAVRPSPARERHWEVRGFAKHSPTRKISFARSTTIGEPVGAFCSDGVFRLRVELVTGMGEVGDVPAHHRSALVPVFTEAPRVLTLSRWANCARLFRAQIAASLQPGPVLRPRARHCGVRARPRAARPRSRNAVTDRIEARARGSTSA